MGMGLDHCIHCVFHVYLTWMITLFCMNYIHGKLYIGKEEH